MTATQIIPNLFQGSSPPIGPRLGQSVHLLALCAKQYQPESNRFPGLPQILRVPIEDAKPDQQAIYAAAMAAQRVAAALSQGQVCLVTCIAGLNRSGLVCGLAMRQLGMSGPDVVRVIQDKRGTLALSNRWFKEIVLAPMVGRRHPR